MKNAIIILVILLASILAPSVYGQWTQAYSLTGGFKGFCFTDSLNGWFTHQGTSKIIHTSDGGYTFDVQSVTPGQYTMYDIYMEDQLNGWSCGGNTGSGPGYIYRTTDGGNTWIQKTHPATQSNWGQIEQVGSSIWIIGAYDNLSSEYLLILKTSDNGVNWNLVEYPQIIGAVGIHLFDSLNFIVYGVGGMLKRTTDGGLSWISTSLPSDYQVEKVVFTNQNIGYALVTDFDPSPADAYLYQSTDGGFTWNLHYSWVDQEQKLGLSVIPGSSTIFVGGFLSINPYLSGMLKSVDSGETWETVMTGTFGPSQILSPNLYYGWAVAGIYIYRYDYVTPPTIEPINNQLIQFGESFTYQVNATGLGLKYSLTGNPSGLSIGMYSGLIDGTPTQGGKFDITVAVKDTDANVVNEQFRLKINRKPHFMPPYPPLVAYVDSMYQVSLAVEDLDDDTVNIEWISKPGFLTFLEGITSRTISGIPSISDTGYHNISVYAADGYEGLDTLSWQLYVEFNNIPPVFVGSWPDTVVVYKDSSYTWNFEFLDLNGDTLFTVPGSIQVPGLEILPDTGVAIIAAPVTGKPTATGWYLATVPVKDYWGAVGTLQFTVYVDFVSSVEPIPGVPTDYALEQNYPNPFNPVTIIRYALPQASEVTLTVYNLLGQKIEVLVNEYQSVGVYQVDFSGQSLPSGIYIYYLTAGTYIETKKMVLLK